MKHSYAIGFYQSGSAPQPPVLLDATDIQYESMTINWNASVSADKYYIDVATDAGFLNYVTGYNNHDAGNVTSLGITGLVNNTQYYYRLRAYNTGNSLLSNNSETGTATTSIYTMLVKSRGSGAGKATMTFSISGPLTLSLNNNAEFTDSSGNSLGQTVVYNHSFDYNKNLKTYVKCTSGTATLSLSNKNVFNKWGGSDYSDGWVGYNNNDPGVEASITPLVNLTEILHRNGNVVLSGMVSGLTYIGFDCQYGSSFTVGTLPEGLEKLYLASGSSWTYSGALPSGLKSFILNYGSSGCAWTYSGSLPSTLTELVIYNSTTYWTYTGALPSGLTYLMIDSNSVSWTYNGNLPSGLLHTEIDDHSSGNINLTFSNAIPAGSTYWKLWGNNINWTYSGTIPSTLTSLDLYGHNINFTYTGNFHAGLSTLALRGNNIDWTCSTSLAMTYTTSLILVGDKINWTSTDIGTPTLYNTVQITNFRTSKFIKDGLLAFLNSVLGRTYISGWFTIGETQGVDLNDADIVSVVNSIKTKFPYINLIFND